MIAKIVAIHEALLAAGIPHAFGGALALAWCIHDPRSTDDIDLNIFLEPAGAEEALAALPPGVRWDRERLALLKRDGQVRLRWDNTPVDLFFSTDEFHHAAATRCRSQPMQGRAVPFLACADLAVFKVFFDRPKDWQDLELMSEAGTVDLDLLEATIADYLGPEDRRLPQIRALPRRT